MIRRSVDGGQQQRSSISPWLPRLFSCGSAAPPRVGTCRRPSQTRQQLGSFGGYGCAPVTEWEQLLFSTRQYMYFLSSAARHSPCCLKIRLIERVTQYPLIHRVRAAFQSVITACIASRRHGTHRDGRRCTFQAACRWAAAPCVWRHPAWRLGSSGGGGCRGRQHHASGSRC